MYICKGTRHLALRSNNHLYLYYMFYVYSAWRVAPLIISSSNAHEYMQRYAFLTAEVLFDILLTFTCKHKYI